MIAHVVTFQGPSEQLEERGMQGFHERVLPVLREQTGFEGTLVLLDRAQGKMLGVTLWDTEEHARSAGPRLDREIDTGTAEMGATSPVPETYEVLAQV
jgi:hypothetical protein